MAPTRDVAGAIRSEASRGRQLPRDRSTSILHVRFRLKINTSFAKSLQDMVLLYDGVGHAPICNCTRVNRRNDAFTIPFLHFSSPESPC